MKLTPPRRCILLALTHPLNGRRQHRSQKTVPPYGLLAAIAQNHDAPERDGGTERHSAATLVSAASPEKTPRIAGATRLQPMGSGAPLAQSKPARERGDDDLSAELARLREAACEVWPGARVTAELTTRRGGR